MVAQLLLGLRAIKRAIFGPRAAESTARNTAVEWRLDSAVAPPLDLAPASAGSFLGRRSFRALALAAALEVAIVVGAIYGAVEHLGHRGEHSGHAHRVEGASLDRGTGGGPLNPVAASPNEFRW